MVNTFTFTLFSLLSNRIQFVVNLTVICPPLYTLDAARCIIYYTFSTIATVGSRQHASAVSASEVASRHNPLLLSEGQQQMARVASVIPSSLSPHICIISSPDLADILSTSSLPPLPQILQSFSPLPQGKTRFIQVIDVPGSHVRSHYEDNILNTSASHFFRLALLRFGGSRRWMP